MARLGPCEPGRYPRRPWGLKPMFTQSFDRYVCAGDTITCDVDGFTLTARVEYDDDTTPPDERQDGYWPSLDPKSDGYIGPKSKATLYRHMAKARAVLDAWKRDEWFYCGVCVTVEREGVQLTGRYDHALWGVECNYPGSDNGYLREVANDYVSEALGAARAKLGELAAHDVAA